MGAVAASIYQTYCYATGSPIDPDSAFYNPTRQATTIRQTVSDGFDEDMAGQLAELLYEMVMGTTDFAVNSFLVMGNGWTLAGLGAYAETGQQAAARGLSPEDICTEAMISAVGEMLIERILNSSIKGTGAVKSIMEGSLSNAGTNVLNNVVDMQLAGELSNLSLRYGEYRAEGLTDEEARQRLLDESVKAIVTDLITGGLTAGIFSGVGNLYSKVQGGSPDIDVVKPIDGDGRRGNSNPNIGGYDNYSPKVKVIMNSWDEADVTSFNLLTLDEKKIYIEALQDEGCITKDLENLILKYGGYLDGLEYRIKSPSSVFEKIYLRPVSTPIAQMNDIVRYTEVQNANNLVERTQKTLSDLESKGYEVIRLKNTWLNKNSSYKGINVQVKSPDGRVFELQFHTPESFRLKNSAEMHGLYEQARILDPQSIEYQELQDKMFELSDRLVVPKDIEKIQNVGE